MAANPHQISLPGVTAGQTSGPSDMASIHSALSFLAGLNIPLVDKEVLDEIARGGPSPMKRARYSTAGHYPNIGPTPDQRAASNAARKRLMVDFPCEILRLISQFLDDTDYLKLLCTCRVLREVLIYDYFLRLSLVSTTMRTVIKFEGNVPRGAFSLLHDLPAFKTSYWELNCHLFYLIHLPFSICKFIRNQPSLIDLCIEYALDESGLLHDKRLAHALSHLLGCIQSSCCRLEICCTPGCKIGREARKPTPASLGRLQAAAKRSSALPHPGFEHVTIPFSWMKIAPLAPFCWRLFASRTVEQLTVTELNSQDDLTRLLSAVSLQPSVITLSLHGKPSHYISIPLSLPHQFPKLEQLSYHDHAAHSRDTALPHIHLPALKYLLLTPTFSSVSMVDASQLRLIHLTPSCYCLDPASLDFCFELAKMYRFLAVLGTLALLNAEVALWMPSGLSEHLSKDLPCFCMDSFPRLKKSPVKGISKIIFHSYRCTDSLHTHFLSFVPFFPNLEEVIIHPSNEHRGSPFLTLLSLPGLESTPLKRLAHGKEAYVKVSNGAWIKE